MKLEMCTLVRSTKRVNYGSAKRRVIRKRQGPESGNLICLPAKIRALVKLKANIVLISYSSPFP